MCYDDAALEWRPGAEEYMQVKVNRNASVLNSGGKAPIAKMESPVDPLPVTIQHRSILLGA